MALEFSSFVAGLDAASVELPALLLPARAWESLGDFAKADPSASVVVVPLAALRKIGVISGRTAIVSSGRQAADRRQHAATAVATECVTVAAQDVAQLAFLSPSLHELVLNSRAGEDERVFVRAVR